VDPKLRLAVITGTIRTGRFGPTVAHWYAEQAASHQGFEVDPIDLADEALPDDLGDFGSPIPAPVARLGARLAAADAFVIVTAEYNHSFPSSLKTAIDWYLDEWKAKPVAFASYGGLARGLLAVEQLRPVFSEVHAVTIRDTVSFSLQEEPFDRDGKLRDGHAAAGAAKVQLDRLWWFADALRRQRQARPYAA
jgi:NAD(P)H-dependent FMN reductase